MPDEHADGGRSANRRAMTYALVTPARDEEHNLPRLAVSVEQQTVRPGLWVIVDNGSTDKTEAIIRELAGRHGWVRGLSAPGSPLPTRGGRIAASIEVGLDAAAESKPDVYIVCDADISMGPSYFADLLSRFEADPKLGIAGGSRYELVGGTWRQCFLTDSSVEGQCRAYRAACLRDVLPLEKRMGWDGIDVAVANACGWRTGTFRDLPFRHHRPIGARDRTRTQAWAADGRAAHYMGYRATYLLLRAAFHARRDPAAIGLLWGYLAARFAGAPRCADPRVIGYVRRHQRLRHLRNRAREATGAHELAGQARLVDRG
jgi:poly-beta-1,6-N-acetyl-D-glucosamine synthase